MITGKYSSFHASNYKINCEIKEKLCSKCAEVAQQEVWKPNAVSKDVCKIVRYEPKRMNVKDNISARFKDLFFSTI